MRPFPGFSARARFTPVPNVLLSQLVPQMDDIAELKVTLHLLFVLYQRKGYPRFVTRRELLGDGTLVRGLGEEALGRGLAKAVSRRTLLHLAVERDGGREDLYFINNEESRQAVARIEAGELSLGAVPVVEPAAVGGERPTIFALYEENIGMLTPMIAEELKDAERLYPAGWIEDAFKEAVARNRRSWRYIAAILKRWETEGREHGEPGRHTETDTDKYFKGKYGHLVRW
ncbi:MAG: DnaD domain protein [Chloroflexota bacterium]|nr:DnaD domain protein [Chloroflexota bacterium]